MLGFVLMWSECRSSTSKLCSQPLSTEVSGMPAACSFGSENDACAMNAKVL